MEKTSQWWRAIQLDYTESHVLNPFVERIWTCIGNGTTYFGYALLTFDSVVWLYEGIWTPTKISSFIGFSFSGSFLSWLSEPASWIGLHKIIYYLIYDAPLCGVLIVGGWLLDFLLGFIEGQLSRAEEEKKEARELLENVHKPRLYSEN